MGKNQKKKNVRLCGGVFRMFLVVMCVFANLSLGLVLSGSAFAQETKVISGKVTDASNSPLPGVTVLVKGTSIGTITGVDGDYSLTGVPDDAEALVFSFIGMKTQEKAIGRNTIIDVTMESDAIGIDEVVAIGYGTQRKGNITGSVSSIKSEDLVVAPAASTSTLLGGKLPGLISVQRSGQPGADAASLSIRGFGSALVIVDGVETSFNNIDPNQIESVSILKDGSASIYGARAGNGVILITTKRGNLGKPTITLNSSVTFQGVTEFPTPVSSGQYAEMAREEWLQAGNPEETVPYTLEEIQKFYEGGDPQYPNTDWLGVLTRDWAPQYQHNLSVSGGSDKVKYFGLIGFLDQETMWKQSDAFYKRYNLQSNLDAKILDNLSLRFDISGIVEDRNFTGRDWSQSIWNAVWVTSPTIPSSYPDPTKIPSAHYMDDIAPANVVTNRDIWGYTDTDNENINTSLSLTYDFKKIEGLSAKVFGNYLKNYYTQKHFLKSFTLYDYNYEADIYTQSASRHDVELNIQKGQDRTLTGQFSLNYENIFGEKHHVTALAMYEAIDIKSDWIRANRKGFLTNEIDQLFAGSQEGMLGDGSAGEMGRASYIGRFTYDYKNKYLLETTFRADASAKFGEDERWGFFPSISVGWRITEENFMNGIGFLEQLKLRANYGRSGNDNVGNFQYLSGYRFDDTYIFEGTTINQGLITTGLANPYLTWEDITIYNAGLDFELFGGKLYGEADAFYREREGIPATKLATLPNTFGANLPQENLNSLNDRGFDFSLGTRGEFSGLRWDVSGNISWSRAKWDHFEEPEYTDPDQKRISQRSGQWTDRVFGYLADGLFTSQDEIDNLLFDQDQKGNETLRPGDIRFIDTNDDGILDWKDQVEIGNGTMPHWMIGLSANLQYRQFDLAALFQGALGHYVSVDLDPQDAISPTARYDLRWTEENNDANAKVPRLGGSSLNGSMSDYMLKSANYLRLKNLSIGYTLPGEVLNKIGFTKVRLYFAGTNLLTFVSKNISDYDIDPEMPSGRAGQYYPQQRTLSFGVNVSF